MARYVASYLMWALGSVGAYFVGRELVRQAWRAYFAFGYMPGGVARSLVLGAPSFWLALVGVLGLIVAAVVAVRLSPGRGVVRAWPIVLVLAAGFIGAHGRSGEFGERPLYRSPNRWGFRMPLAANREYHQPGDKPNVPDMSIETNSFGFRDRDWTPEDSGGRRRVLVVGDSFVWGYGIPDASGMLHTAVQKALDRAQPNAWEVVSVATTPAGMWYYANVLEAMLPDAEPDYVMIDFLGYYDIEEYELARAYKEIPPNLHEGFWATGLAKELMVRGTARSAAMKNEGAVPPELESELTNTIRGLFRFAEERGVRVLVWSEYEDARTYLDRALGDDFDVAHLSWCDVTPAQQRVEGDLRPCTAWQPADPALTIQGDGHPTATGNAIKGEHIARRLLELAATGSK